MSKLRSQVSIRWQVQEDKVYNFYKDRKEPINIPKDARELGLSDNRLYIIIYKLWENDLINLQYKNSNKKLKVCK